MHYWTGANLKTSCGQTLKATPGDGYKTASGVRATGIDSLVKCGDCKSELRTYRQAFPQNTGR